jgi:hypothetical protein
MAHLSSLGASIFTTLNYVPATAIPGTGIATDFGTAFVAGGSVIANVRDFPAIGAPANIVKVPGYGAKQSKQVMGQSDAPNLELTINYIASDWASGGTLMNLIDNDTPVLLRFALMNAAVVTAAANKLATDNSCYYWLGKLEAIIVKPSLTDATTATVTLSMLSDFYGAFTHVAV